MARGIYKRGNIYWIRYAGLDGKTVFESSGSDKFREAEALLIKRKQAIKEGKQPEIKKIANHTFNELTTEYLKWAERQRSYRSKKGFVLQLVEVFGNLPLRRFNTKIIEQLQTERIQKGNKPATVNRLLATIKHMFTKAVEWDMVEDEVLKRVRRAKLLSENNRRLRYLSKEECQGLISSCEPHLRPIVITALNTGMRKGEILSLKWDNVDLKHGFILLDKTKNGDRREIPINNTLRQTLQVLTRRLDIPYVFYDSNTGKPYQDVKRSFITACRRAGIRDFRFHDLRHTFASHLVMTGVDLTTVKELLGHKDIKMTLRYAHLAPSHKVKAVDMLDSTLNEPADSLPTIQKLYNQGFREVLKLSLSAVSH
ncbi:MAG: tyrosine-type recombinase/integrase [Thermodesulfovibrionales bacterium]